MNQTLIDIEMIIKVIMSDPGDEQPGTHIIKTI
jgi:hypothetical protein